MKTLSRIFVIVCAAAALAPLAWHVVSSLKTASEISLIPPTLLPHRVTFFNYEELFIQRPFLRYYLNSFTIAAMSSLISVMSAALLGYRLARMRSRLRSAVRSTLLAVAFFPPIVFLFPLYELIRTVGLVNHPWGLILPYAALNLPFATWLVAGSFAQIPYELEEAAAIDGLSRFDTFRRILLPLVMPAMITAGILVFIFSWNEFMFALTFMNNDSQKTVTLAVASLSGAFAYEIPWGQIAAGVIASSLPLVALIILFERRIISGLTAGAGK